MLSQWPGYIAHQASKSLPRFWPRVCDGWYQRWPITPSPEMIEKHGSSTDAKLVIRKEINGVSTTETKLSTVLTTICTSRQKIRGWYHNRARAPPKTSKSSLRLQKVEKRKLAPAQAYCTYAWDSGLKEIVTACWKEERSPPPDAEEDGLTTESAEASTSNSIPIDFKIKIAKEIYEALPADEKKKVLNRIEEDRKKMYQPVHAISDLAEKVKKLSVHEKSGISISLSLALFLTVVPP